ncbi:tetratricopeptide repeat protein [Flagellimonas pelagia]|uniref:Tetratricopeptide repeat protein n=1 Tax=Flagellimonas pelagia TaxID=2306998 RepID=A0A3A1NBT6_9FLAO|nr:tetratricopeptide repeat protein [Allomuricauda maritima]RIV41858.1 tetratricopeptide repeat protein [Allomuricauda maritima]TXJ90734.1 tetratricopeptide repeat protein [Allomuricauda maritima]
MRNFLYTIFLISLPICNLPAQDQQKTDSLIQALTSAKSDSTQFDILNRLWFQYIDNDIDQAVDYSEKIIQLGQKSDIDSILTFGYERKAVTYAYMNNFDSSGTYFRKALSVYKRNNDLRKMAAVQRNLGQDHNVAGKLDSAFYYYDLAENNYETVKDSIGLANIYNSKAIVYLQKGYFNLALQQAFKTAEISEKHKDSIELVQNQMVIAATYAEMKDTLNAIAYHEKILTYFERIKELRQQGASLFLLSALGVNNPELYKTTQERLDKALQIAQKLKDPSLEYQIEHIQCLLLFNQGKVDEAISRLSKLVEYEELQANDLGVSEYRIDLGRMQLKANQNVLAETNLLAGLKIAKETDNLRLQVRAYDLLSKAFEKQGQFDKGLEYQKQFKTISDSIYDAESQNRFSELQTIYETEKKEAEIALQQEEINTLNEKAKVDKLTKSLYAGGMASALALTGLVVFGYRQRMKKNKVEREKQEEIYKQEIAHKKKELASQTLHLVQKNTFIQELMENLESIKNSPEKFKMEFRRIVMLLKKENASDKDWEVFKTYFAEVHNDFDQKLRTLDPDISEKEIRLAAFLRMNLTTKEMAATLNVLPDSILKSKYRLKKKLGLDKDMDLSSFLNTL